MRILFWLPKFWTGERVCIAHASERDSDEGFEEAADEELACRLEVKWAVLDLMKSRGCHFDSCD